MFSVSQNTLILVIAGVCLQFIKVVFNTEGFGEYLDFQFEKVRNTTTIILKKISSSVLPFLSPSDFLNNHLDPEVSNVSLPPPTSCSVPKIPLPLVSQHCFLKGIEEHRSLLKYLLVPTSMYPTVILGNAEHAPPQSRELGHCPFLLLSDMPSISKNLGT